MEETVAEQLDVYFRTLRDETIAITEPLMYMSLREHRNAHKLTPNEMTALCDEEPKLIREHLEYEAQM